MSSAQMKSIHYIGKQRIFLHERPGSKKPYGLRLPGEVKPQWFSSDINRETAIKKIRKQQAAGKRIYRHGVKFDTIKCQCGCGETFTVSYSTRKPKFNPEHYAAYANKIREAKRAKAMKVALAAQRARRLASKKDTLPIEKKSSQRAGRVEGERGREGEGASPSLTRKPGKGLFADEKEPAKTAKRRKVGLPSDGAK